MKHYFGIQILKFPIGSLVKKRCPIMFHCAKICVCYWLYITISKPEMLNWIRVESLETINKLCGLHYHLSWQKSNEKKSCRNVNFEEMDTERLTEKKWWTLIIVRNIWGVYQKNIIMAVWQLWFPSSCL